MKEIRLSHTGMMMLFKHGFYYPFVSQKQFDFVDFLSFVGGISGLLAGFSALSFIELMYWLAKKLSACFKTKPFIEEPHSQDTEENFSRSSSFPFFDFFKSYFQESSIHSFLYFVNSSVPQR
jgi:hypothetical protein